MDLESAAALLEADPNYRVLRRVQLAEHHVFAENSTGEPVGRLAVVETETTGFSLDGGDRIIDIAIATCEYGRESGTLYRVVSRYESLEDPGQPIPAEVVQLTGITDEMVRGQKIDDGALDKSLEGVGLVVCHNSAFDRPFLEDRFPAFREMHFGCSFNEVPWRAWGIGSSKLDYLGFVFGLFHTGHRARADVDMLAALLGQNAPGTQGSVLSILLAAARQPTWRIYALGLSFDNSQYAKLRGYRWHKGDAAIAKSWWIETRDEAEERKFLQQLGCINPLVYKLTARERYRTTAAIAQGQ